MGQQWLEAILLMPQTAAKASPDLSASLAEYFADREGLTGIGRVQFLDFIEGSLGASQPQRPGKWQTLLLISVGVGVVGLMLDTYTAAGEVLPGIMAWGAFSLLGIILAFILRRAERRNHPVDHEIHWRAYCLLLRPVVLVEKPGLLDRNLADDEGSQEQLELTPLSSFRYMLRERGADFWWSGGVGILSGMLGIILWHRLSPRLFSKWEVALPLCGMLIGPAVWALIQYTAYWLARRQSRHLRD